MDAIEPANGYHWRSWSADDVVYDAFKIFIPTLYEPRLAPPGGQVIILQRIMEIGYDRVASWPEHKRRVEEDLLARLEAKVPGIGAHIVSKQSASAETSWRFTLNRAGAMLGWEMSPGQLGTGRPPSESGIHRLHFTGHWTRPGGGITPVIISAMQVAQRITG
jgi:prolycopene isomerase